MTTISDNDVTSELVKELKVEMWGEKDAERLIHYDLGEAVGCVLDDITEGEEPATLVVWGFARKVIPDTQPDPDWILEGIFEYLDEHYGDPEDASEEPTDDMKAAAQKLAGVVRAQYFVWQCDPVLEVEVDVKAWMAENYSNYSLEGRKDASGATSSSRHSDTELKP